MGARNALRRLLAATGLLVGLSLPLFASDAKQAEHHRVLVELFTSQG